MPFSSLIEPTDLARAHAALEDIWREVKASIPEPHHERERTKIAYLVAAWAPLALDDEDLKQNVLLQYRESPIR